MDLSERGMKMLFEFEGRHKKLPDGRYKAYRCPANVATIYVGLTRGVKDGMIVTEAEGEKMLRRELIGFEDAVERLVKVELTQPMFDALVLFSFNVGVGALEKSTLLKLLNQGKPELAAAQFMRWTRGGGRVLPGLVKRRKAEASLFLEPAEAFVADPEPSMPQRVEETQPSVTKIAAQSPSIWASLIAVVSSSIGAAYNALTGVAADATAEVGKVTSSFSGLDALWSLLKVNTGLVLGFVTIACLAVVILRKLSSIREGA